jgi:hypothetical protein
MGWTLSAILFASLFVICPAFGAAAEDPANIQQVDEAKVAEIQALLQRWAQLRPGMTVEEVEAIVGSFTPLEKYKVDSFAQDLHLAPERLRGGLVDMTQEISQSYNIRGTTLSFTLFFNTKRKLVRYWLDNPAHNGH